MHFGSLIAATTSYLSTRKKQGKWLLRIEDVDTQREKKGACNSIIKTLEAYDFEWDDEILYQSQRTDAYHIALKSIEQHTYPCSCTRKELRLAATTSRLTNPYPGFCRKGIKNTENTQRCIRVKTNNRSVIFTDKCQKGSYSQNIEEEIGDFILKRSDGLFAYQLAVVVDDASQGITDIVRGADLYDNTPRQIFLQEILGYPKPNYLHFPVAVDHLGKKLSKHNFSPEITVTDKRLNLIRALDFLGQQPPALNNFSSLKDLWLWAFKNWDSAKIPKQMTKTINT